MDILLEPTLSIILSAPLIIFVIILVISSLLKGGSAKKIEANVLGGTLGFKAEYSETTKTELGSAGYRLETLIDDLKKEKEELKNYQEIQNQKIEELNNKVNILLEKNNKLETKMKANKNFINNLRSELYLLEKHNENKSFFKNSLSKIIKSYINELKKEINRFIEEKYHFIKPFTELIEYDLILNKFSYLGYHLMKKGMDDFDMNGFQDIGTDIKTGTDDHTLFVKYFNNKITEYLDVITDVSLKNSSWISLIGFPDIEESYKKVFILVSNQEFEKISVQVFKDQFTMSIQDLYQTIIARTKIEHIKAKKMKEGLDEFDD